MQTIFAKLCNIGMYLHHIVPIPPPLLHSLVALFLFWYQIITKFSKTLHPYYSCKSIMTLISLSAKLYCQVENLIIGIIQVSMWFSYFVVKLICCKRSDLTPLSLFTSALHQVPVGKWIFRRWFPIHGGLNCILTRIFWKFAVIGYEDENVCKSASLIITSLLPDF